MKAGVAMPAAVARVAVVVAAVAVVVAAVAVAAAIKVIRVRYPPRVRHPLPSGRRLRPLRLQHGRQAALMTWMTIFRFRPEVFDS